MLVLQGFDTAVSGVEEAFAIGNAFATEWLPLVADSWTINGVTIRVGQDVGDPLIFEATNIQTGTASWDAHPPNTAYLIKKLTTLGGRQFQGRSYVPSAALISQNSAGVMDVDFVGSLQTSWNAAIGAAGAAFADGPAGPVLLHSPPKVGDTPVPTPIAFFQVERKLATQRRRMRP
jgi:hypothetical protein